MTSLPLDQTGPPPPAGGLWRRLAAFDPGLRELRGATLAMGATLASYGSALALEHAERLGVGVVVLAVVLALTLSRSYQARDPREWLLGLAVLSVLALAASEVGSLLVTHEDIGDGLFVLAISGSIWIRRFGSGFARAGTLVTLPFVALLIVPAVPGAGREHLFWAAVIGAIAYLWVSLARTLGAQTGFLVRPVARAGARSAPRTAPSRRRLSASTRMALQMGVALAASFAVGRALFASHWPWLVLTAFIVCSGNRGRGDVVYKSALRIAGAGVGTIAATLLAGRFAAGDSTTVILIFIVLYLASWLRPYSYAYWAAGVTGVLALLYGYFGEAGTRFLGERLEGILLGALIAIAVSWVLLPVRTSDVVRRRLADMLAALSEVIAALSLGQAALTARAERFDRALAALEEISKPLEAHRFLTGRGERGHLADTIDAARRCRAPVATVLDWAATEPEALTTAAAADLRSSVASSVTAARRALIGRHGESRAGGLDGMSPGQDARSASESALAELDDALRSIAGSYRVIAPANAR